jgi:hypothetical protein
VLKTYSGRTAKKQDQMIWYKIDLKVTACPDDDKTGGKTSEMVVEL